MRNKLPIWRFLPIFCLLAILSVFRGSAQPTLSGYYKALYSVDTMTRSSWYALYDLDKYYYENGNSDSALAYSNILLRNALHLNNDSFIVVSDRLLGNSYYLRNDHIIAIGCYGDGIKIAEANTKLYGQLPRMYNNIGFNYNKLGSNDKALVYLNKAEELIELSANKDSYPYIYENLAYTYMRLDTPDLKKAGHYLQLAEDSNRSIKNDYIQAAIYLDYGTIYDMRYAADPSPENLRLLRQKYERAISFSDSARDHKHLSNANLDYGASLFNRHSNDSARSYALKCLDSSRKYSYVDDIISSADLLRKVYDQEGNEHEAYRYACMKNDYTDTLKKQNNLDRLLAMTNSEESREQAARDKIRKEEEQRILFLRYTVVVVFIISLILTFFILSRRTGINEKYIGFFGGICLLIVFEFINLVLHPLVDEVTHHTPFPMLMILVLIAAILIPIHHALEGYVRRQCKNRQKLQNVPPSHRP